MKDQDQISRIRREFVTIMEIMKVATKIIKMRLCFLLHRAF